MPVCAILKPNMPGEGERQPDLPAPEGPPSTEGKRAPTYRVESESIASERHPEQNEDAVLSLPERGVFGVFDGMGGHAGGEIASQIARDGIARALESLPEGLPVANMRIAIQEALFDANAEIRRQAEANPEWRGMGTTASVVKMWESPQGERKAVIGQMGDSRIYVLRAAGELEPVTIDNVRSGDSEAEVEIHREAQRFLSTVTSEDDFREDYERAWFSNRNRVEPLGAKEIHPKMYVVDIKPGDRLLLTSDGIHDNLTDAEIADLLKTGSGDAARELSRAAQERSRAGRSVNIRAKPDDMSAIVVDVSAAEQPPAPERGPTPVSAQPPATPGAPEIGVPRERIAELRAYMQEFRQARGAFVTAEKEQKQDPEAYEQAKTVYETKRAEYVGASVNRMLKEREQIVELEVEANPRKVGLIEKQWRAWGEVALIPQSWREGFDHTAFGKTRVGQMFIRSLNMRTALSLSLWGVAVGSGFGSIVGIGSLIARSGVGAAGTYFGSQALMEGLAQKRRFTLDRKKFDAAAAFDLHDTSEEAKEKAGEHEVFLVNELARLEAAALLAGRKVGDTAEYREIRKVYRRYAKAEQEEAVKYAAEAGWPPEAGKREGAARLKYITEYLEEEVLRREKDYKRGERGRKALAGVLATAFPITRIMALSMGEIATLEGRPVGPGPSGRLGAVPEAVPPEASPSVTAVVRPPAPAPSAPVGETVRLSPEAIGQVQGLGRTAQEAPATQFLEETVRLGADAAEQVRGLGAVEAPGAEAIRSAVEAKAGPAAVARALETLEKTMGPTAAIQEGGSIWKSAMRLVESNQISKADFESAWRNSLVDIEGQGQVPIHKVGLVHAGDKLRFIPAEGVHPPRFEIMAESKMPLGSDQDLYAAYEQVGREAPEWLKESVGAPVKPHEVLDNMAAETPDTEPVHDTGEEVSPEAAEGGGVPEAPQGGENVATESETSAEHGAPDILADLGIRASVDHFHASTLAEQSEMLSQLADRAAGNPAVQELLGELRADPAYMENFQIFERLISQLTDAVSYTRIKAMRVGELLSRVPERVALEATAGWETLERGEWRIAELIRAARPDEAARQMSVHAFLQTAPKYLWEIIPKLNLYPRA